MPRANDNSLRARPLDYSGFVDIHRAQCRHAAARKRCIGRGAIGQSTLLSTTAIPSTTIFAAAAIPAPEGEET
jgi:hypothetical protein